MPENPYIIVPYSPAWPAEFRVIAGSLRAALGLIAMQIDHIGSTSVPGLCSKDVIDVQVTVADLANPGLLKTMGDGGFQIRPTVRYDHIPPGHDSSQPEWEKYFFREPAGTRTAHIHIRRADKPNQRYALLFRDYLRTHVSATSAYAQIKQRLAPKLERLDYIDAKDPVCDLIMQSAEVWAAGTGWKPSPSGA